MCQKKKESMHEMLRRESIRVRLCVAYTESKGEGEKERNVGR